MDYDNPKAAAARDRLVTASMCFIVLAAIMWGVFAAALTPDGARFSPGLLVGITLGGAVVASLTAATLAVMAYLEHLHRIVMRRLQGIEG